MTEQVPFGTDDFAENPEPRCPCVLLLDTSGSMRGDPISELNAGIRTFKDELIADTLAAKRVEVGIITFGPVQIATDFHTAASFDPPTLHASGDTPMGAAILKAIDMVSQRKATYRSNGIAYYRPWVFLITDGAPTDQWAEAARGVHDGEEARAFAFFSVGVEGANFDVLRQISVREPLRLKELRFRSLFQWLSSSLRSVSQSTPGDQVPIQNPAAPGGWASV